MTAPSIGAKDILVAASIGVFTNPTSSQWAIRISKLTDTPDQVIALFDTGGLPPEPKWLLDYPDISCLIRGRDYQTAYTKAKAVQDALLGYPAGTVNGDTWAGVIIRSPLTFIGYDEKDRAQFSITFGLFVEPANVVGDHRDPL